METKSQKYPQQKISRKIIAPGNRISIIIQEQREKKGNRTRTAVYYE